MFETLYDFSLYFAWGVVAFEGFYILYSLCKRIPLTNNLVYPFLLALAWILANWG